MKTICFFNLKGGCGKTTALINIAAQLAEDNKVLLVDTDMQSNLTSSLIDYDINRDGIYQLLVNDYPIDKLIVNPKKNTDLIASSLKMAFADQKLNKEDAFILKNKLEEVKDKYDYCLIDCSPSFSNVSVNALMAADKIFIPLSTEYYAIDGVDLLQEMLNYLNKTYNSNKQIDLIFAAIHDRRNNINKIQLENLKEAFPNNFLDAFIRKNVSLVESPVFQEDIFEYKPNSIGAKDYKNLFKEISKRGLL